MLRHIGRMVPSPPGPRIAACLLVYRFALQASPRPSPCQAVVPHAPSQTSRCPHTLRFPFAHNLLQHVSGHNVGVKDSRGDSWCFSAPISQAD